MSAEQIRDITPRRVLVVEDDRSIARMLRVPLRAAGFEVHGAAAGEEALRFLERGLAQAVVLDLGLPDGLGAAVLAWLRRPDLLSPPVWVVMSALERTEASRRYGHVGSYFFAKPFDPWELVATLELLLDARAESPSAKTEAP